MFCSIDIRGTAYCIDESQMDEIRSLSRRVQQMRSAGRLGADALANIRRYFKIKNIYHSNAIEGNLLDVGETRQVVEFGLTITGKPLKDQAEARNLSQAIDYLEHLARRVDTPITEADIRLIHSLVLSGINDEEAGKYRSVQVEISGSGYKPPGPESVPAEMESFSNWLKAITSGEPEIGSESAMLSAAVAHAWLVSIHPFVDGNGRVSRLLMNLLLMRHGFPIAIITKEDRLRYYDALETSQSSDLSILVSLLLECIHESLEEYEIAVQQQVQNLEWARAAVSKLEEKELIRVRNKYELFTSAMDLFKSYFKKVSHTMEEMAVLGRVFFVDFGSLAYEKYLILTSGDSAKRTWFFRIDFKIGDKAARYLFYFGYPSRELRQQGAEVTLHVAREYPDNSYNYTRLDRIPKDLRTPTFFEFGYLPKEETFTSRRIRDEVFSDRMENLVRTFIDEVVSIHFK